MAPHQNSKENSAKIDKKLSNRILFFIRQNPRIFHLWSENLARLFLDDCLDSRLLKILNRPWKTSFKCSIRFLRTETLISLKIYNKNERIMPNSVKSLLYLQVKTSSMYLKVPRNAQGFEWNANLGHKVLANLMSHVSHKLQHRIATISYMIKIFGNRCPKLTERCWMNVFYWSTFIGKVPSSSFSCFFQFLWGSSMPWFLVWFDRFHMLHLIFGYERLCSPLSHTIYNWNFSYGFFFFGVYKLDGTTTIAYDDNKNPPL